MNDDDEFAGQATVIAGDRELPAEVRLRGHFQPIDGRFHWYGRLAKDEAITELVGTGRLQVVLRTPQGQAEATLAEPDTWGRYRITGQGRPPFTIPEPPLD